MSDEGSYGEDGGDLGEAPFGLFNSLWMMQAALSQVPQPALYEGVMAMVDYLVDSEEAEVAQALDVLTQTALVGCYHNPFADEEEPEPPTEEEIDAEVNRFHAVLKGLPTVKNTMKDDKEGEKDD